MHLKCAKIIQKIQKAKKKHIRCTIVHLCLDRWCTSGAQTWCSSGRFQLTWAVFSAMSTIIAVREQYASNEGLAMMHMDHAGPFGGAIVHLCLDQWCASGAQTWCSSVRFQLNWAAISAMSTIIAVQDAYGSRRALRRCNRAPLSRPVVHLRCSDLVLQCTISADLSYILRKTLPFFCSVFAPYFLKIILLGWCLDTI